jgi:hypothetical protein
MAGAIAPWRHKGDIPNRLANASSSQLARCSRTRMPGSLAFDPNTAWAFNMLQRGSYVNSP